MANSNVHNNNHSNNSSNTVINSAAENPRIKALRDQLNSAGNNGISNGASSRFGDLNRDREFPDLGDDIPALPKNRNSHKDILDTNHDNSVSDQEIMAYELNRRKINGEVLDLSEDEAAQKVLSAVDVVDKNEDGIISAVETLSAILASKAGVMDISDANIAMILNANDKFAQLKQALANISTFNSGNGNSAFEVLFALNKAGLINFADWTQADYLKDNPQIAKFLNTIKAADPNADGVVDDDEAIKLYLQFRKDLVNTPYGELSKSAINYALLTRNQNATKILNAINLVDTDTDGIVSDKEAQIALQKMSEYDGATIELIKKILATNPNYKKPVAQVYV